MAEMTVRRNERTFKREIVVENAPPVPAGYPRGEYEIQPHRISYAHKEGELPTFIWIEGNRIRKDGSVGTQKRGAHFSAQGITKPGSPALPQWALEIIEGAK